MNGRAHGSLPGWKMWAKTGRFGTRSLDPKPQATATSFVLE
jgi:hypothetical protein